MSFVRRELPTAILALCGILLILEFFIPSPILQAIKSELTTWSVIIAATSCWLGFIYMAYAQLRMLGRNPTTSQYFWFSLPFIFFLLFFIVGVSFPGDVSSPQYRWLITYIYQQVGAMVYAVMFFTLSSAAYRTFKVASIEAIALLLGGTIYMLRQIPLFVYICPWLLPLGEWILLVPNAAGGRGAVICAALGALAVGLRTLAGREVTLVEVR